MIARFRTLYGEHPLHLLGHLVVFAGAAYAIVQLKDAREARNIFIWLIGAAILHDAVFLPLYVVADRVGLLAGRRLRLGGRVPVVNHVRFVAVVSGVLLVVYFPLILRRAPGNIERATGKPPTDAMGRWLAITGGLILVSAVVYGVRVLRGGRVEQLDVPVASAADEHPPGA